MKFNMYSIMVGSNACIAHCPFCVSGVVGEKPEREEIDYKKMDIGANLANRSGVDTVMITSYGEPCLYPSDILYTLKTIKKYQFPFIELQTNGILLASDEYTDHLKEWYQFGLTTIAISVVSEKPEINKKIYCKGNEYIDLKKLIKKLHNIGFCVRLTCILQNNLNVNIKDIDDFIRFGKENKVEQITLRPLNEEYRRESAYRYIEKNKLTDMQKEEIQIYLRKNGTKILEVDNIGNVFDINGQNVMFSYALNKNTKNDDPENLRNLIFIQNHLKYRWEQEGAILL